LAKGKGGASKGLLAAAERRRGSRRLRVLTAVLGLVAAVLALLIGAGTLYVLVVNPGAFSGASSRTPPAGEETWSGASDSAMFTFIGRMRIRAGAGAAVVLSIVFPYPPADRPFTEELSAKVPRFRQIAQDYFESLSQAELDSLDEQKAKAEILRGFNDELRLGQIESILFNDLLILE
jgi:flagellar basal body-associated protein FliL